MTYRAQLTFAGSKDKRKQVEGWVKSYSAELHAFALLRLNNHQDAEDILQLTFLKAFRSFDSYKKDSDPRAWLYKIMLNNIIDLARRKARAPVQIDLDDPQLLETMLADTSKTPESLILEKEKQSRLAGALAAIPEQFATPLIMKEIGNFTYQEIASMLVIPIGTVMSRLSRARKALSDFINDEEKTFAPRRNHEGES